MLLRNNQLGPGLVLAVSGRGALRLSARIPTCLRTTLRKMFKMKPVIPPRPKIPTVEQIIEDIEHSSTDDSLFQKAINEDSKQDITLQQSDAESVYGKVKEFVETNIALREMLHKLQDQNEALKISDLELKAMADDIRKQALDALQ